MNKQKQVAPVVKMTNYAKVKYQAPGMPKVEEATFYVAKSKQPVEPGVTVVFVPDFGVKGVPDTVFTLGRIQAMNLIKALQNALPQE